MIHPNFHGNPRGYLQQTVINYRKKQRVRPPSWILYVKKKSKPSRSIVSKRLGYTFHLGSNQ